MRVLLVTTWFPTPSHPSTGAFVVKDAAAIAAAGHDVHIVHLVPGAQRDGVTLTDTDHHAGLPVTRIPMTPTRPDEVLAAGRRVKGLAAHADLVHTVAISALLPMSLLPWRPEVPWVHTEHWSGLTTPSTLPAPMRAAVPALSQLYRRPDVVTAVCDYLAAPIRAVRGESGTAASARPTAIVPCIVPVPDPVPARPDPGESLRLVSIGGLIPRKDPLLAVDTVAYLNREGQPARLVLVGDGPLREDVTSRAATLGVSAQVEVRGTLDRDGVLAELATADLFFGPTRGDNFFVSCAEALVAGRPVVVGSTGGQGEYIDPAVGGLVDEQTPEAYADAIRDVVARTAHLSAEQISDTIGDRFSAATVGAGYDDTYRLAAGVAPTRRGWVRHD